MIEFLNFPWMDHEDNVFLDNLPPNFPNGNKIIIYNAWNSKSLNLTKYRGHKIVCYSGENLQRCGYASPYEILNKGHYLISMERIEHENYLRLLNIVRAKFGGNLDKFNSMNDFSSVPQKTKFCSYIQNNCEVKYRNNFVKALSDYKKVDCLGPCLNNINHKTKIIYSNLPETIEPYKFHIAFENSSAKGYCTEKIWWGFLAKTISIYWGDPTVTQDFNQGSFLNRHEYNSDKEFIDAIIELDNDDNAYLKMLIEQKIRDKSIVDINRLRSFLKKIVNS